MLLRILTLIALLVAPLASFATVPVAAAATECAGMDMAASRHRPPADHHHPGEPCCTAIAAAIAPPPAAQAIAPPLDHPDFFADADAFLLGAGPKADDPPPRMA
jgi:hypothetical protein